MNYIIRDEERRYIMLKIGEFSKLSFLTVKALRFYEKEGLLVPAAVDEYSGYRYYETEQLVTAARIKAYRQIDLSIEEIREILKGEDEKAILERKRNSLIEKQHDIARCLSIINMIMEGDNMKYQATVKDIPEVIVYYSEKRLAHVSDKMTYIPQCGAECMELNPGLKCRVPEYEFVEYLDEEYSEENVLIRHSEAVEGFGVENENIKFRKVPETKVLSIYHKGSYEELGNAYAFIMKYAEDNGYDAAGPARECYIDGIWNKESEEDWLTEIQLPIE